MSDLLNIEVAYALPERQTVLCIRVAPGTSVLAAIELFAVEHHQGKLLIKIVHIHSCTDSYTEFPAFIPVHR